MFYSCSYDTANGMDCCNCNKCTSKFLFWCYDTANGMDCCNNQLEAK